MIYSIEELREKRKLKHEIDHFKTVAKSNIKKAICILQATLGVLERYPFVNLEDSKVRNKILELITLVMDDVYNLFDYTKDFES